MALDMMLGVYGSEWRLMRLRNDHATMFMVLGHHRQERQGCKQEDRSVLGDNGGKRDVKKQTKNGQE